MNEEIEYGVAETEADRREYIRIRKSAYAAKRGSPDASTCAADKDGIIIIARKNGLIFGGARLVLASRCASLPIDKALPDYRHHLPKGFIVGSDCADYGGVALQPGTRRPGITLGLFLYTEKVARSHLVRHVLCASEQARARLYLRAYHHSYGGVQNPPTTYQEVCDLMPPEDSPWRVWGLMRLSIVSFHYSEAQDTDSTS
ncbi:N-acyl amino acid synthase FeeM domain-containing protein [Nitrosomonas sp. wSCUT-2]